MAVRAPFMIVLSFLMSFNINPSLSMIFLVAMPLLALGMYLVMSNAHPIFVRVFKTYDKLNAIVQENLRGIRVVKSFVREDHEKDKFKKISESIYKDFLSAEKILAFNAPIMQFCMYGCILLISWLGARFIVAGNMSTGQLASFISYTLQILLSLMMLAMVFIMIVISKASAARIVEILKERPNIKNPNSPIYKVKDGSITFNNVSFSYVNDMNRLCLSSVNLKINSGETVGIIGSTGSSKSTLVQLIPRLYDATYGAVYVGGSNVRDYDIQALRASVAFVLQQNVLFSGTIKENLLWGNKNATDEELIETAKLAQAHDFIMSFEKGYDSMLEQGASNLSGGQKQRICIARALLKKPKILILDDSTSAVDTKTDSLIRKALREYIPETTKIIIAQRISSVEDADKIMVIDNGKINAFGTHEELISANYIYQDIYNSQIKGGGDFDEQ
jgi:ATP-binding cassette subfamily B protein